MRQTRTKPIMRLAGTVTAAMLLSALPLMAQQTNDNASPPTPPAAGAPHAPHAPDDSMGPRRPPMERAFRMGPPGRWWDRPEVSQKLNLTADQQKKMDEIFQQSRLKLIDQHAAVEKEEAILEPLVSSDQPDEGRILSQIDKVAQSRAELEKTNARMLLGLRRVLTPAQWHTLRTMEPGPRGRRDFDRQDRGPRGQRGPEMPPAANGPGGEGSL